MQRSGMGVPGFRVQDLLGCLESILDSNDQGKGPQTLNSKPQLKIIGHRASEFSISDCALFSKCKGFLA